MNKWITIYIFFLLIKFYSLEIQCRISPSILKRIFERKASWCFPPSMMRKTNHSSVLIYYQAFTDTFRFFLYCFLQPVYDSVKDISTISKGCNVFFWLEEQNIQSFIHLTRIIAYISSSSFSLILDYISQKVSPLILTYLWISLFWFMYFQYI